MTSELRKSLESIQSLLSQAKSPGSIGIGATTSSDTASKTANNANGTARDNLSPPNNSQDVFRRSNDQRPHQPFQSSQHQTGSSVSFQIRSIMSPTNSVSTPATQPYAAHVDSYGARKDTSSSSSLCNFANSPYNHAQVRPFSSDEHGGIIGSPLSAFSEFKRQHDERASIAGSAGSGSGGKKGRETSLLVSPLGDTAPVGDTPGTARQQIASPDNLNQVRTSLYGSNHNTHGRDPTPYHHRQHSPPYTNRSERSDSSRESRSGMDPPAKSPFGSAMAENKPALSVRTEREEELSMIQESASFESKYESKLDQSLTSEVTGLTLPRTPVWRGHNMTPMSSRSKASVATGVTGGTAASPSKMMRDSLVQLANQTASRLESLWDTIGVHPDERAFQLSDLIENLSRVCDDKISEEEGCVAQFRKEIDDMRSEWEKSCVALGIEKNDPLEKLRRDPSAKELPGEGLSLQSEYEAIAGRLESVRAAIAAAKEDAVGYQQRIHEAFRALNGDDTSGELEQWSDVETDLTEERREKFRAKALELEESVVSRTKAVVSLTLECQTLIRELEIDSEDGENAFGAEPEVGRSEDDFKIMNSLQSTGHGEEEDDLHHRGQRNRTSDMYTMVSLFESPTCLGIGKSALDRLTKRLNELNSEKRRRRSILAEMGQAIQSLWAMLRVPSEEQKAFTDSIHGLSMDTIRKGERELDRLHKLKAVMTGKLIRDQRKRIEVLWEQTNSSPVEKASFDQYFYIYDDDKLTDELLAKHEEYASTLTAKLQKMQPILDLIAKREAIVSERFDLEMLQKDPERLKGRFATKQLMKEEKMTRRVQKELPRITSMLEKALVEWYHNNRPSSTEDQQSNPTLGHFLYQGVPYLETMHNQEQDWKMRKEQEEQERHRKRDEERSTKQNNAFGSTYTKLPGRKWNPSIGSTSSSTIGKKSDDLRPRSASNARAASNPRGGPPRPLADVSGSRANVPRATSRSRNGDKPIAAGGRNTIPGYRSASAPRQRL
ncbi:hypothetical protein HJC23_012341 [Cyclotella cryptica]|uniref:Microtubule associated protein n=1 Tax=Cyclotella cryptica TaxID=29204 RepID=A0ABD3QCC4_9STRA|eukprot:CCRYP_006540-RA/>CCRYP_006540-RA protein AED:0.18 eAED:0.18 QI:0/-1/0/1/-1/1/1/0/1004